MGCYPTQLQLVVSSESIEGFVAAPGGSASNGEGGDCLYGGEAVGPYDDMFVCGIGKIVTGLPYSCEFCLENCTVVWEFVRSLVNSSIVLIVSDEVAGSTA